MAYIKLTHTSPSMGAVDVSIYFPTPGQVPMPPDPLNASHVRYYQKWLDYDKSKRLPVLWLLHGGGGDFTSWPLESMSYKQCLAKGLVVVMPTFVNPFGMVKGMDFRRYLTEDLPRYLRYLLPLSDRREDNFIAGLSYGGYFAYQTALNHPENYACVGSFSSPLNVRHDVAVYHPDSPEHPRPEEIDNTDWDVLYLAKKLQEEGRPIPKMFQCVGTEDFTWNFNVEARDHFRSLGLDHTWDQWSGIHNFDFWDTALKKFIDWLPIEANRKEGA